MLIAPESAGADHLKALATSARLLRNAGDRRAVARDARSDRALCASDHGADLERGLSRPGAQTPMKARVIVTLKSGVLDPQGKAIEGALQGRSPSRASKACARARSSTSSSTATTARARAKARRGLRAAARQHDRRKLRDRDRVRRDARGGHPVSWHPIAKATPRALCGRRRGARRTIVWHGERELPAGTDLVVLPGGFSYGDYLRCGAIAARAPIMQAVGDHAARGGLVLGICNGFQILCEAGLLPGVLMRNAAAPIRLQDAASCGSRTREPRSPAATRPARWSNSPSPTAKAISSPTTRRSSAIEADGRVAFRYCDADGTGRRRDQSQRLGPRHRRRVQRAVQRPRADAASGKPDRSAGRRHRRARAFASLAA